MRVEMVPTNWSCNQNCRYCTQRRSSDEASFVAPAAVVARIDAVLAKGAQEIRLSGGEPTLRRDFAALVRYAKSRGAKRVVLETNATLIDDARARALHKAELDLARVNLSGFTPRLDELTRDPGGFEKTVEGVRALLRAGVRVEIVAAVLVSTLPYLEELPARLAKELPGVAGLCLTVPVESPDESELVSYDAAARAIAAVAASARRSGIAVRLDASSAPPPCVFPERAKVAHLFSMTRGARRRRNHEQLEACSTCVMSDSCSGFSDAYVARFGAPAIRPIQEDRIRRRLSMVSSVEDQIAREMVTLNHSRQPGAECFEQVIRINFQCNQACRFCFVSTHLPAPEEAAVREAIFRAGREGARIVFSGGEPTLNPKLFDYVRLAKTVTERPIEIQTNAVLLEDAALVEKLVDAGVEQTFVSLHGSRAEVSDTVTGAPGTFERTVRGIDNLARSPITTILNFVICQTNYLDFVPFVRLALERWPNAKLNLSFVAPSTDLVPRERSLIPRYTDVVPEIAAGMRLAEEHGREIVGFNSMCGVPLCLVPTNLRRYFDIAKIVEGFDGGEFVRADACRSCALQERCYGLRRGYAALYGDDELRPIRAPD